MVFNPFRKTVVHTDPAQALAAGDYERAAVLYREQATSDRSRSAIWHKKAGEALVLANRSADAVQEYLLSAAEFARQDRMVQAIALYRMVVRLDPENATVQSRLAEISAVEPDPESPVPYQPGMTIRTRLRKFVPLFSEFDRDELTQILDVMEQRQVAPGAFVFRQGQPGDSIFILVQGELSLFVDGSDDEPVEIERLVDNGFCGEVSALTRAPRNMNARAVTACELLELTRDYLEALAIAHPNLWSVLDTCQKNRRVPAGV